MCTIKTNMAHDEDYMAVEYAFSSFLSELDKFTGILDESISEHLEETPQRVAKMWIEMFNVEQPEFTVFESPGSQPQFIFLKHIPFYSLCAHHWLPIVGHVTVGYLPQDKIVGLSKLARTVDYFARRPQVQEKMTTDIAEFLYMQSDLEPMAVGVHVEAEHYCMSMRGVHKPGIKTVTQALRGTIMSDSAQRAEYMHLLKD